MRSWDGASRAPLACPLQAAPPCSAVTVPRGADEVTRHGPPAPLTGGHAPLALNTPQLADPQTAQGGRCCQLLPGTGAEAQRGAGTCLGQQCREALGGRRARPGGPPPPPRPVGPGSPQAFGAPWLLALTSASSLRCSRRARRPASGRSSSSTRATSSSTSGSTRTAPARSCPHPGSACPACTCAPWRCKPECPAPSRVPDPAGRDDQRPPSPGMGHGRCHDARPLLLATRPPARSPHVCLPCPLWDSQGPRTRQPRPFPYCPSGPPCELGLWQMLTQTPQCGPSTQPRPGVPAPVLVTWGSQPSWQEGKASMREQPFPGGSGEPPSAPSALGIPRGLALLLGTPRQQSWERWHRG